MGFSMQGRLYQPISGGGHRIKGVIFDMDGTLTVPCIDFKKMRELAKVPAGEDILTHAHGIKDLKEKERCWEAIEQVEAQQVTEGL